MVFDHAARIYLFGLSRLSNHDVDPRVLIVTPSFQQGEFLGATIQSVLSQTNSHCRYVVADGGSRDGSHDILRAHHDQIDHILWGPDKGQSDAIKLAIDASQWAGQPVWFNWINSDDLLAEGCIESLLETIRRNPRADAIAFDVEAFGDDISSYTMPNRRLSALAMLRDDDYRFAQPGLWCRLDNLAACGGIDRALQYGFDWDMWVRYLARFPNVVYTGSIGAKFRLHGQSKTSTESEKDDSDNAFQIELIQIRQKLAQSLPPNLARWCQFGHLRRQWHVRLAGIMDDVDRSPVGSIRNIAAAWFRDPRVVGSSRTIGAVARLLSRYVRPASSWRGSDDPKSKS